MDYFFPASEFGNSSPPLRTRVFVRCSKARWTISNAACVISNPTDEPFPDILFDSFRHSLHRPWSAGPGDLPKAAKNPLEVPYNGARMKAYVYVSLKKSVLDPQGKTIQGALKKMGYKGLGDVRQGKYFELTLDADLTKSEAQSEVERIAREVLTNPVIEEYRYSLEE